MWSFSQRCEKLLTGMYLSVQKNTCSLKNWATVVYKEKNETYLANKHRDSKSYKNKLLRVMPKRGNYHSSIIAVHIIALYNYSAYCRTVTIKKLILAVHFLGNSREKSISALQQQSVCGFWTGLLLFMSLVTHLINYSPQIGASVQFLSTLLIKYLLKT